MLVFGVPRIRRRQTPYVTVQTATLIAIQALPLFLLPEILLPWLGHNGSFDGGVLKSGADALFPAVELRPRARVLARLRLRAGLAAHRLELVHRPAAVGLARHRLAADLRPHPALVWRWGKGAYCGWICSCGALAETLGDDAAPQDAARPEVEPR